MYMEKRFLEQQSEPAPLNIKILQYFFGVLVFGMFYCEWVVFVLQPVFWSELKCPEEELCTNILFIANPHIQGEQSAPSLYNRLYNMDSYQYLQMTFSVVSLHFQPHVLVYLGSMLEEGTLANMDLYQRYIHRRDNLLHILKPDVEVWIPGQNNIGENEETAIKDKVKAIEKEFQDPLVVNFRNISFYKLNGLTTTFSKLGDDSSDLYKIIVSQYPVTFVSNLSTQIINEIQPNILFCTHNHESKHVKYSKDLSSRETFWMSAYKRQDISNDQFLHEIYVPSSSYRMGTNNMGYGAAMFEHKSRILRYTVFWSPQRFSSLCFYASLLIFIVMYAVIYYTFLIYNCLTLKVVSQKESVRKQ